ncbi:IS1182 family transposase [Methylophaga sp.]|uniref:IS1182 family transposase n=1 Tax=Methylophaga sp. TaxID=2024840 RepID=UPI00271A49DA|nr:IS1182 family transposase [Methylophaga sp.]MDO8825044.1 IS1182 family transposase [Methylophaga sp.]
MVLREYKMGQSFLLPLSLNDLIPKDHICFFVTDLVNEIDFQGIEKKYQYTAGKAAYSRCMLMRVVIMASVDGVFSSRQIMKLTQENMVYMFLTGTETPDFRTINRFKIEAQELIEKVFQTTVFTAKKIGLLQLEHISIDGTKIKANASKDNNLTEDEIQAIKKIIQKGIDVDKEEDEIYGDKRGDEAQDGFEIPSTRKERKELIRELLKDNPYAKQNRDKRKKLKNSAVNLLSQAFDQPASVLEKLDLMEKQLKKSGQKSISTTDPDSRWMMNKKKRIELSYNMQIAVDHKSGIILSNKVTQEPTDHHQLIPQIEQIKTIIGPIPKHTKISADNGYFTQHNIEYIHKNKLDAYIPNRKQATTTKNTYQNTKPFSKHNFNYDHHKNVYFCPNNKKLPYKKTYTYKNKQRHQYYTNTCLKCKDQEKCAGKNRVRIITDYGNDLMKQMSLKMETPQAQLEYSKRKEAAEWPFGNIKQNLRFIEYYTRGIKQTITENNLICISHNIKRIFNQKKPHKTTPT